MVCSPQDVYARLLSSDRGYPLWTPEPDMSLPTVYVQEGLKIGDVGVVAPTDGSFDVLFNVDDIDIAKFPDAEIAGRIISTSSVTWVSGTRPPDENSPRRAQPGPLDYNFTLSPVEGAALILPEGAERYYARNVRIFMDKAAQHAADWYNYAEQRRGRIISHDALYLITGFYKARSWSVAAYRHDSSTPGTHAISAQFKAVHVGSGNIAGSYTWQTTQHVDWRAGPSGLYHRSGGIPNQTVFIKGLKFAVREGILGTRRVDVKVDSPSSTRPRHTKSSRSYNLPFSRTSSSNTKAGKAAASNTHATESNLITDESDAVGKHIMIEQFPPETKVDWSTYINA